jgi:branched-chain amino acid transport system permease protein
MGGRLHDIAASLIFIVLYSLSFGMVLFAISIGLVITMGLMRMVNMAHGFFAALGAYVTVWLMFQEGAPMWLSVVAACVVVILLSVLIERLLIRRLYTAAQLDQVLLTIGLAFLGVAFLNLLFGPDPQPSALPPSLAANIDLGIRTIQTYRLFVVVLGACLMLGLWWLFDKTDFGARIRAAVDNRRMAEAVGIDVDRLFAVTFVIGCCLAALGGAVGYAMLPPEPMYPFKYLVIILIVVALTGFGNIKSGAFIAAAVGLVDTAGRFLAPTYGSFCVYFFLIGMMVWQNIRTAEP